MDKFGTDYLKHERIYPRYEAETQTNNDGEVETVFVKKYQHWDSAKFVNVYIDAIKDDFKLSNSSWKVFMMLLLNYRDKQGEIIYLHWEDTIANLKVSKNTYYGAIKELEAANIIAKHERSPFCFYINKNYLFNGKRFKVVKEYKLIDKEDK